MHAILRLHLLLLALLCLAEAYPENTQLQLAPLYVVPPFSLENLRRLEAMARRMRRFGMNETCPDTLAFPPCHPFDDNDGVPEDARNASQVRFKDIHYVAALGDSITAGFGMLSGKAPQTQLLEYRGHVFSIGAGPDTLPAYIERVAGHRVWGASVLPTLPLSSGEFLNRAVTGAHARDLRVQVLALLGLPRHVWKLLTVFVGGNDVCQACHMHTAYLEHLTATLDTLRGGSQRWVVNVVGLFKVSQAHEIARSDPYCYTAVPHQLLCPCLDTEARRKAMDSLCDEYNLALQTLSERYQYPDFKVNYQPGLVDASVVPYNLTYISKIDCFHPNLCLNRIFAYALWNNMLERKGEKTTTVDPAKLAWKCPSSDNMYIQ